MLSRFFIVRPVFAWVIAIVIMLAGALSILRLPVSQYPEIALPQINVSATYQGASAKVIEDSVTQIIEQGMNGIDGLKYMSAQSSNGSSNLSLVFEAGTNPDIAQVQVQNKVQAISRLLPQEVQALGTRVNKANNSVLMAIALYSTDNKMSNVDLGDYLVSNMLDSLSRIDGVGATRLFGSQYSMRIWLNADRLATFSLVPSDIINAIRAQNTQVSAGSIGAAPTSGEIGLNASVSAQSRFNNVTQFENIIVKNNTQGSPVLLKDVARIELGSENYSTTSTINAHNSSGIAILMAPGANALKTADAVERKVAEFAEHFPPNLAYGIPVDSTQFVKISIEDVIKSLIEAVVLVFVVMFVFLQNWRATLIPAIAVPVVLLGTFGVLAAFGYSINTLTMFGLVMAIGLLVDDAIVVVENVERLVHEEGLSPLEATQKSMDEITGALIGVASVLAAMFIPMAFFGGTQGIIYRQFSVTLISAMVLSVLVAVILTPPLCATLLKPHNNEHKKRKSIIRKLGSAFNEQFNKTANWYHSAVKKIISHPKTSLLAYLAIILALVFVAYKLPTSFLPDEDQGAVMTSVQLPPGSSLKETDKIVSQVRDFIMKQPNVRFTYAIVGGSTGGAQSAENQGQVIARLKPFSERKTKETSVFALQETIRKEFGKLTTANITPIVPPPVRELGNASGFIFNLKDVGGLGHEALLQAKAQFLEEANKNPKLSGVRATGLDDTAQLKIDIDNQQAGAYGVQLSDVNSLLSAALGGIYVNDFIERGRVKKVYLQADAPFRMQPQDINRWYIRNSSGGMVPFSAIGSSHWQTSSPRLERYNGSPSIEIQGQAAIGESNGVAMAEVEKIISHLPEGIGFEWTGISAQEKESGQQAPALYAISLIFIFLLLAALYESWTLPVAVILIVPLGVFGAFLATWLRGLDNDIYFQVGLLTTMGLAAKNAILILEFAKTHYENGASLIDATLEAVRIRFRPIIMTSLAFTFGILPLVFANSAGSGAQHSIGTGLLGGVITASLLAIFFVPLFFILVNKAFKTKQKVRA